MEKEIYTIEYPLNNASSNFLWPVIGTPLGLAEWFSDGVTVNENEYTFSWGKNEQTALLQDIKPGKFIRFQWADDVNNGSFFQIEIHTQDVTGNVALVITDFAAPEDKNDSLLLWDNLIEILKRKNGI